MKHIKSFILFFILSSFFAKGQQIQIGSSTDSIQFSQIITGSDSSLYFLGSKNYHELFVLKTNLMLDTLWTFTYDRVSNFYSVNGYQIPGSGNIFIWSSDSIVLKIDRNGQIISENTILIPGEQFQWIGGMLMQNDTLLLTINFRDSIYHSGIAFADTNLTISGYHEYSSDGISDIQKFDKGYYLKSAAIIFIDSAFNYLSSTDPSGYTQYQQGARSFSTGNVMKVNDSVLFVHQIVRDEYEPTNDDQYYIYKSSGPFYFPALKDDFDFVPSFNYKLLHCFSDGRKLLLGENWNRSLFTYMVDSTYTPISVTQLIQDTTNSSSDNFIPTVYSYDKIYFAFKNIIGTIDTLGNSCNATPASVAHDGGAPKDYSNFNLNDTAFFFTNSILSYPLQTISRGIVTADYCNIVGIDNTARKNTFEVYPNPFTDYFEIKSSDLKTDNYILIDPLGRIQARIKGTSSHAKITNLCSGIYYLGEIETGNYKCLVKE